MFYAGATDQYLDEGLPAQAQTLRRLFFASCWHMAEHESELMWHRYGNDGFAIKSSVTALRSSILDESHCFLIGPVQYLDYSTDLLWEGNAFNALFAKKREYEADREFRIACELLSRIGDVDLGRFEPPPGLPIDVDLPKLIQAIVYRRGVDPPQLDMAQTISKQSGLQACFELSALDEEPSY